MNYSIENDLIRVEIASLGAELMSIQLKADGCEYLWQGNAEYWSGRAYNLFPICGRLTDGKYTYGGKTYEMNLHGFARKSEYSVVKQEKDKIIFRLAADERTLAIYPFDFELFITYTLEGTAVRTHFEVRNHDTKVMYFALGAHPGFNVPLAAGEQFEDYYLEFACEKPAKIVLCKECYVTGETAPMPLQNGRIIPLRHDLFDDDAIFMCDTCKKLSLKSRSGKKSVTVEFPEMKYVGIWHKPLAAAPYVCIEPWQSVPAYSGVVDQLETKRDMNTLASGEAYAMSFTITIQ